MGMHTMGLLEKLVQIRELSAECVRELKDAEMSFPGALESLSLNDKIAVIENTAKKLDFNWQHVPSEWDDRKQRAS